ncbi:MAG: glycosyltransferase family 1 protein [Parcubacteria group bacterium]
MRIGIDARFYGPIGKGLGRYTQKLIENMEKISAQAGPASGGKNQYFVFLKKENFDEYQPQNENFQKVLADFKWYGFAEQLKFPRLLKKYELDLVHFPHFNVPIFYFGKFIVTIHDLILLNFPTIRSSTLSPILYWLKFTAYKMVISSAVHRSCRIIAVSNFTKKDILKNYPRIPEEKVVVTYEACDDYCLFNFRKDDKILPRYGISKPYLLYVGNVYPHKNPERLVMAMKKIEKENECLRLVFVGGKDYFYERLRALVKEDKIGNIVFAGFVPDYDLDALFRNALAYVRPSLHEGFELPGLEAMSRGVPVLVSDYPCSREILGESASYFDGKDVKSIADAIRNISTDEILRQELIRKGYEQAKKYSWKKMAEETRSLYGKIKMR